MAAAGRAAAWGVPRAPAAGWSGRRPGWLVRRARGAARGCAAAMWVSSQFGGEGNGNPFQDSCLENSVDRGAWWAAIYGVARSRTRLSDFPFTFHFHALEK